MTETAHDKQPDTSRILQLETRVLAHNDDIAAENRRWLARRHVVALNLISSPGAGKTALLEQTLERLRGVVACAVIVGDQETDNDARRLEGKGAPVIQIETKTSCHLNADQIQQALTHVIDDQTDLLFIENIGNLVCPAGFDLGETFKVAVLSQPPEGEDKPIKYPVLFTGAKVTVLTKTDLIPYLDWDLHACRQYLHQINPKMTRFEVSNKTGEGLDAWIDFLIGLTHTEP